MCSLIRFSEVIRLIIKWLNAGVMEDGKWRDDLRGTSQGSLISPILANVYLHYVFDLWFQKKWRSHGVSGDTIIVRYADDFVVGFQHKWDAERFLHTVKERFERFDLAPHPDKTRLIEFGRYAARDPGSAGRADRRPSIFWGSRTTAPRPDEGTSCCLSGPVRICAGGASGNRRPQRDNRANSTSRALKTARELIGVRAALNGQETLLRAVQDRKSCLAPAGENCEATRTGYGMGSAGSRQASDGSEAGRWRAT